LYLVRLWQTYSSCSFALGVADEDSAFYESQNVTQGCVLGKQNALEDEDSEKVFFRCCRGAVLSNLIVPALAINPIMPTTLYAGTSGGVYQSTDSGGSWSAVNTGLSNLSVSTLAIDPTTPSILYAVADGGNYQSIDSGGVYRSTDRGSSWSVTGLSTLAQTDLRVLALAIDPTTPSILYAATLLAGSDGSIYRSTDSGGSWSMTGLGGSGGRCPAPAPTRWRAGRRP
jgi:photosystem II stability/assembly factor-like uncharacterized protein